MNEKVGSFENNKMVFIVHFIAHFILLSCTYMVRIKTESSVNGEELCISALHRIKVIRTGMR